MSIIILSHLNYTKGLHNKSLYSMECFYWETLTRIPLTIILAPEKRWRTGGA